jgi:hypothetical protein
MFLVWVHFPEGDVIPIGYEYGIVAEAPCAARRPDKVTRNDPFKELDRAFWICKAEHANELRSAMLRSDSPQGLQTTLDLGHSPIKVSWLSGPARRVNAGRSAESFDGKARIIRKRESARFGRSLHGLQARILLEGIPGLLRLGDAKFARGSDFNTQQIEQVAELAELALIVRGDDKAVAALKPKAAGHGLPLENCQLLQIEKFADALFCEPREFGHAFLGKDGSLGARLDLDYHALAGEDEIRVGLGLRIFRII